MITSIKLEDGTVERNIFESEPNRNILETHLEPLFTDELNLIMADDLKTAKQVNKLSVNVSWLSECKSKLFTQEYILSIQNDTFTDSTEDTIHQDLSDWLKENEKKFIRVGKLKERSIDHHDLLTL